MTTNITDVDIFTDPIVAPDDGDSGNGATFQLSPQGLANRTYYIRNRIDRTFTQRLTPMDASSGASLQDRFLDDVNTGGTAFCTYVLEPPPFGDANGWRVADISVLWSCDSASSTTVSGSIDSLTAADGIAITANDPAITEESAYGGSITPSVDLTKFTSAGTSLSATNLPLTLTDSKSYTVDVLVLNATNTTRIHAVYIDWEPVP